MEQREFSKLILKFLEGNYPQFAQTIKFQDDGSFDCDLKSESGIFSIWIATYYHTTPILDNCINV